MTRLFKFVQIRHIIVNVQSQKTLVNKFARHKYTHTRSTNVSFNNAAHTCNPYFYIFFLLCPQRVVTVPLLFEWDIYFQNELAWTHGV